MEDPARSPMEKRLLHQTMYKNARGRTPPWKDVYRKRCMERLRSSRAQLVDRFRSSGDAANNNHSEVVREVMEVEWAAMSHARSFPSLKAQTASMGRFDEEEGALLTLMEEIQHELMCEEERLLMDVMNYDAAVLASQVAAQQREEVICPVCQVQGLQEVPRNHMPRADLVSPNMLACGCGLALRGANLTLNTVKSSLENTLSHHGQSCAGQMSFSSTTDTQGANVLVTCTECDWMSFLV